MEEKVIKRMDDAINKIIDEGLNTGNLDNLYKLSKIRHMAKEDENMYGNYGNYGGRRAGYDSYGRENYGRRGVDLRYRGDEYMDRMNDDYGRYMESRSRYGAGEEVDKAQHYMVKSLEEFVKFLYEDAETPQQKQMITEALQRSMR